MKKPYLIVLIVLSASCAAQVSKLEKRNSPPVKYGTIVYIGRIKCGDEEKLAKTGISIGAAGYRAQMRHETTDEQVGAESFASGLALGSVIYYGGEAFGARDSLEISIRLDDGGSEKITQKVKLFEHFGIGERVKILNDRSVTH
ncbi:MAG: hypothetical protein ABI600_04520 [Luteolibacter sp.]